MVSSQKSQHALPPNARENKQEDRPVTEEVSKTNDQSSDERALNKSHEDFEFQDDSLNNECLTRCLTFICNNMAIDEVIAHLQEEGDLTRNDAHLIFAKKTPYKKNDKLIEFVQQRGPRAFSCFMKSLTETGQKCIFDKLIEERKTIAERGNLSIQHSLREIYSQSYRNVIPFSLPFFFDIERKWVTLTLKLECDSTVTEDYATLLKKAFVETKMLIIEGNPGFGKSSLMHRLAYEWSQSRLSDYDLVLHIEFRKLREYKFKDIKELVTHFMKGYLDGVDFEIFHHVINDTKCCKVHKILVLLDGYDESALEKQCQEVSDFFSDPISRPLRFYVLITSRKGYLSKFRNQGRFTFADIIGFTNESQRKEYVSKHFHAESNRKSSENTAAVICLLNTNANLKRLSESPLMLTFICLLHKRIIDGTEVELYMNIIWWMIDRYQKSNPSRDVPSLFDFKHDASDKFHVIENNYQYFPQLHKLGTMAMEDIFKTTFTETDLKNFQLNEIVLQAGLLRKEETRDDSYHTKTEFSFVHRTIQEFIMALTFFFSHEDPPTDFIWLVFLMARNKGYGIISANIQAFLNMISSSKIKINEKKKNLYIKNINFHNEVYSNRSPQQKHSCIAKTHSQDNSVPFNSQKERTIPQSSGEAIQLLHDEAEQGDALAQFKLGLIYDFGIITIQSDEEAFKWYTKSAEHENANAQFNLGLMFMNGRGTTQADQEAVEWFRKSAELGNARAQLNLGVMYEEGKVVPQSDEEAVKWYTKSAEQGNAHAQYNLAFMYQNGRGVSQSDEEAVKWYTKSAEQGDADAQFNLGLMFMNGRGTIQSDQEAVKWFRKSAEQGNARAQLNLGVMYEEGKGVPQSDKEAVTWYTKSAEQGNAHAKYNLALMYGNNTSVTHSDEEAVARYKKSAVQGNTVAQFILGFMYANGKGVPKSNEEAFKWYTKSAEHGDANAQFSLGVMFANGKGVPQSAEEAVKWFRMSAEQEHALSQNNLGWMYKMGHGVPRSDEEADKWLSKSADKGHGLGQDYIGWMNHMGHDLSRSDKEAVEWYAKPAKKGTAHTQCNLGNVYNKDKGLPQSEEEAARWYRKAAEQGIASAQFNLGFMYMNGKGVFQSDEEAVKWFKKSAEQGNANAQYNLGWMYRHGQGVPKSDGDAVKWFQKSAEQGNIDAQFILGFTYEQDNEVSHTDKKAVKWYTKSAEQGNANAQNNLGFMYRNGQGVPQSNEEAVKWYTKSAIQGNAIAQYNLGLFHITGNDVLQSDEEALKWFRKSAEQGHARAQFNLGFMFANGKGVPLSDEEAVIWYRKSAEQGNADAQYNLGFMYEEGKGVHQSDEEAVKWYRKSAAQGQADGQNNLGYMYQNGRGAPQSERVTLKWFRTLAEQEYSNPQFVHEYSHEHGNNVLQRHNEAVERDASRAEYGDARAQGNVENIYDDRRGGSQVHPDYLKWLRISAEQRNENAPFDVRVIHANDKGAPQSDGETAEWYRESAEQESANVRLNRTETSERSIDTIFIQKMAVPPSQLPAVDDKYEYILDAKMHNITKLMNYISRKPRWVKILISAVLIFTVIVALAGIILFIIIRSVASPNENINETSTAIPTGGNTSSTSETLTSISIATTSLLITRTSSVTYSSQTTGFTYNTEHGSTEYVTTAVNFTIPEVDVMAPKVFSAALNEDSSVVCIDWVLTDKSCPGIIRRYELIVWCNNDQAVSSGNLHFDCRSGYLGPMLNGTVPSKCKREDIYIKLRIGTAQSMSNESEQFLLKYGALSVWVIIAYVLGALLIAAAIGFVIFCCYYKRRIKTLTNAHQIMLELPHIQRKDGDEHSSRKFRFGTAPDRPPPDVPKSCDSPEETVFNTSAATSAIGTPRSLRSIYVQYGTGSITSLDSLDYGYAVCK